MPTVQSKENVKTLLESTKGARKPVMFVDEISKLKSGEGLLIGENEWSFKTSIPAYYYRFNKNLNVKTVSVAKVKDGFLITKL